MGAVDLVKMRKRNADDGGMRTVFYNGSTHYPGCEYDHTCCAIEALCQEVENLRAAEVVGLDFGTGWVGVDLDGTLATNIDWTKGCGVGVPIKDMVNRVIDWLNSGADVRIFTARVAVTGEFSPISNRFADEAFRDEQILLIEEWCKKHIGQVLPITCQKDFRMIALWDDRAVQVIANTGQTLEDYIFEHPTRGDDD